jgi:hypothetical protein
LITVDNAVDNRKVVIAGAFDASARAIIVPRSSGEARLECPPDIAARLPDGQVVAALVQEGPAHGTPAVLAAYTLDVAPREFKRIEAFLSERLGAGNG